MRHLYQEDVHENLLCALFLPTNTTGAELFQVTGWLYIRTTKMVILCRHMHRRSCCHDWTLSGLTGRIKEVAPESESMHCIIHREMLASRKISPEFNSVLLDVVKLLTTSKHYIVRRWTQGTDAFSYTHKLDGYLEGNR